MSLWNQTLKQFEVHADAQIIGSGSWRHMEKILDKSTLTRIASADPIRIDPERFSYVRSRAVSAYEKHGLNDNGDGFEHDELLSRHPTFVGAGRYLDHNNDNALKTYGLIVDAVYHEKPGWVEAFSIYEKGIPRDEYHKMSSDDLIDGIRRGHITDTSMGCLVAKAICTLCNNEATTPWEYCTHVQLFKGIPSLNEKGEMEIIGELNRGVTFFELSDITTAGADPKAKHLQVVAGTNGSRLAGLVNNRKAVLTALQGR